MKLSETQVRALKTAASNERGILNDADGFTLRTARSLGRRELVVVTTWSAYNSYPGAIGWSAALTDAGHEFVKTL